MSYYEVVFMARQDLTDNQVKDLTDNFSKVITDAKGKVLKTENWGLRTLAYRINKARKAHYVLLEVETESEALHEMERLMRLNEDVMRHLTIRLDEPTEGPSPIMDKSGNDDDRKPYRGRDDKDKKPYKKREVA